MSNPCALRLIIVSTLQCSKSVVRRTHNNVIAGIQMGAKNAKKQALTAAFCGGATCPDLAQRCGG
jgi:hypothetical protein